jgi:acetolactate decarboxylase
MSTIDPALVAALDIRRERRDEFDRDPAAEHAIWQTSSIDALLDGAYEGDLTLAELTAHGDLGIGTVQQLDGELILIDGECFRVAADGTVHRPDPAMRTPFAVVCRFAPGGRRRLDGRTSLAALTAAVDAAAPIDETVFAVRVVGSFGPLLLRSVPRQHPPYPSLAEVVTRQTEWTVPEARGSIVGFRFPDYAQGIDVPGYHLHFISDDRSIGGHVLDATLHDGTLLVDGGHELHVEVPAGVRVGDADLSEGKAAAIRDVEGQG